MTGHHAPRSDRARYASGTAGTAHLADQLPDSGLYTSLTERLAAAQRHEDNEVKVRTSLQDSFDESNAHLFKLGAENIFLGRTASTKEEAIRFAGEQLVKGGYVQPEYVDAMLEREN